MDLSELFFGKTRTLNRQKAQYDKRLAELKLEEEVLLKRQNVQIMQEKINDLRNGNGYKRKPEEISATGSVLRETGELVRAKPRARKASSRVRPGP